MNSAKIKQFLFLVIASLLAVFFVYITAEKINFQEVKLALAKANYFWILLSMSVSIFTYYIHYLSPNISLNSFTCHNCKYNAPLTLS